MSIIWNGKPYDTLWDMYVENFEDYMREPTLEERQSIEEGIKKISKPTGINFYDYLDKALEEDDELRKEYEALEEEYDFAESERPTLLYHTKIKNGSKLTIGRCVNTCNLMVDQHFNWFQKLMWKWCFGIKVKDYSEE